MKKFKREITFYEDEYEYSIGYFEENGCFHRIITFDHINHDFKLYESILNRKELDDVWKLINR